MFNLIAQIDIGPAIKINQTKSLASVFPDLASLVNLIVPNLFLLAGVIFLFLLILGGFSIIAGGTSKEIEEGQKKITTALIGFIIMFSAFWIIQVVEYLTGLQIL